jgi:hypothetical protein
VKRRTANPNVLRFGDEEIGDAASSEERPQRPENLGKKRDRVSLPCTELAIGGEATGRAVHGS